MTTFAMKSAEVALSWWCDCLFNLIASHTNHHFELLLNRIWRWRRHCPNDWERIWCLDVPDFSKCAKGNETKIQNGLKSKMLSLPQLLSSLWVSLTFEGWPRCSPNRGVPDCLVVFVLLFWMRWCKVSFKWVSVKYLGYIYTKFIG